MARDYYNEVKGKNIFRNNSKKKKKETESQKVQSPSVSKSQQQKPAQRQVQRQPQTQAQIKKGHDYIDSRKNLNSQQKEQVKTALDRMERYKQKREERKANAPEQRAYLQRQKSGLMTADDYRRAREANEQRKETVKRVATNTGRAIKKGATDAVSGYGQTLLDVDEMIKSDKNWTAAKAQKMGIDTTNKKKMAEIEQERQETLKKDREDRLNLARKQEERQKKFDEQTKNASGLEKAWYGAAESGTGMLIDTGIGAATGTGQFGALASMGLRTYGTTRGQAEKEGATEKEDRLYALAQAGKEVGTELMFPGAGLARKAYGKVGLDLADKTALALTKGLTGKKADVVSAGVKLLGGTAEENAEELAGWGLDPLLKETIYGKNVRQRMADTLKANLPKITSQEDADRVASYFSTSQFTDDLKKEYVSSGMSQEDASKLADQMRDYYVAYYSGDEKTFNDLEDKLTRELTGTGLKSSWSMDELKDTLASTTLLTMATGLPGAATTSVRGNAIFDSDEVREAFGDNAVNVVADAVKNVSDPKLSIKAEAYKKRLDEGKDLTGTQKYELYQGYLEKVKATAEKKQASESVIANESRKNNYVPTVMGVTPDGQQVYAKETQMAYNEKYASTSLTTEAYMKYMDSDGSISQDEMDRADAVNKAVADLHVGGLTVGDTHEFAYGNTLAREVLKEEEGIDLNDYVVRDSKGNVDLAATNEATENALFELNAKNALAMAKTETEVYIDDTRGSIDADLLTRFGNSGQAVWKSINKDLDPRDLNTYLTHANADSYFYAAGRNTDMSADEAVEKYGDTFKSVSNAELKRAFAAGQRDRIIANTPGYGQTVKSGSNIKLKKTEPILSGQLIMDDDVKAMIPDSVQSEYLALAEATGANIHLVSDLSPVDKDGNPIVNKRTGKAVQLNGMSKGNDIWLNVNTAAEQNLGYVFMHEMTHQIKQYAPNEYMALENLVRDKWFNKDYAQMQRMIKERIDLYKTKGGQSLTEEEALEEIIADAMAEAIDDPNFAAEVCETNEAVGQQILNAIKSALRSIRDMFARDEFRNENFHNALLSYLGILDDAEKMWLEALAVAKQNKANGLIADWQDRANRQSRYSTMKEQWDNDEKLSHSRFNSWYSAHKLNLRHRDDLEDQIADIKENGFITQTAISNVMPASINDYSDMTLAKRNYGARKGDTVLLVPRPYVDLKDDRIKNGFKPRDYEIVTVERDFQPYYELYSKAYDETHARFSVSEEQREELNADGIEELDDGTTARYSLTSWNETNKDKKLKALINAGHSEKASAKWINDINSIASIILADQDRLDYIADRSNKFLKPNGDYYKYTLDASTLCDKRRIYQGTYDAIQHMLPDSPMMQEDVVRIRTMLKEMNHKAPCGICYVESQRKNLGDYAKQWYDTYARKDEIRLEDVTTTDGLKKLKETNPEVANDFEKAMSAKGVSSPKVVKLRTDYREDIMRMRPDTVKYLNSIGGLRFHSFSDFETPHLIDTMQAVMDMSAKGLMGMAYAKVPNFAAVFGPTGIKINLSLIAKTDENGNAVHDENGRLVFDSVEGIPFEEANKWREAYPDNVAFILVGKDKEHTLEAINDDRVDFVIPFHRSKWSAEDMRRLGLIGYEDFATGHQENGIFVSQYWDYNKTGKENAEAYLKLCAKEGVTPVFEQLLVDKGDGSYELQPDGSTDNYWKLLVEGKMYNHKTKKGAPQKIVQPNFNMEEARRVLSEYEGGANELPVAQDVVEAFVKEYVENHPDAKVADARLSISAKLDDEYMDAVNSGDMDKAQSLVDEAAKMAGYTEDLYHGTGEYFNVFKMGREGIHLGNMEQASQISRQRYHDRSKSTRYTYDEILENFDKLNNEDKIKLAEAADRAKWLHASALRDTPDFNTENFKDKDLKDYIKTIADEYGKHNIYPLGFELPTFDRKVGENLMHLYAKINNPFVIENDLLDWTPYYIAEVLLQRADGKTNMESRFEAYGGGTDMDISGSEFNPDDMARMDLQRLSGGLVKGDQAWQLLDEILYWNGGYDGIKYLNKYEGDKNSYSYIALNRNAVKSADTVTYAEDGSVIPLSERFDPNNDDIRYSMPTQDAEGNILTDGQMEYFANSQARDEQGRLVPVYHSTDESGFTIFDPMQSEDHRSLFFTDDLNMSKSYFNRKDSWRGEEGEILDAYNLPNKPTKGTYAAYLNLENPLLVNGMGHNWDDIPYGGNPVQVRNASLLLEPEWDMTEDGDPLLLGYTLDVSWEYLTDDSEWETKQISNSFDNPNPEEMEWFPKEEIENYVESEGLSKSFFKEMMSNGEEEEMDGSIRYQSEEDEETTIYDTAYTTREISEIASNEGYDSVIIRDVKDYGGFGYGNAPHDIYVAFSSNQIKDIDNENPTENPDIRYSVATRDEVSGYLMQKAESITDIPLQNALLEDNRIRYSLDATNFENSIVSEWDRRKRNLAEDVKDTPLKRSLIRLMKQVRTDSGEDKQYSTEAIDETIRSLKKMYYYAKGDKAKDFAREAWDTAERIVGDINYNDVQYLHYKGISEYFADTEIYVPEELIDDDTFIQFAKDNAGRIRLFADKGIKIEEAWESLHDAYPDLFPRAAFVADSPVGMLIQMDWVLNQLEPYKEAYTSEEHSKLVEDLANTLCNIVEEGNEYNATVNDLNVRAMKQRHSEALRKVREQEKQKRDNQKERAEKWKQKYLERVAKNKADKEAGRQKKNEAKLVGDIEKNIKWLSDRLRPETRTKDNAIPEQFRSALGALLAEFDLQSKGSKKIEKKEGYPSKTTLKLKQLREQYASIAKENDDDGNNVFRYNGDLLVKMDELIKTMESLDKFFDKHYGREVTIADLSLSEMFIIDTMLKSLVHEFREYKNVTIESKRAEISGVSSEVIGDMDTQIGRHGTAREGGALGRINGLLNMSEVTPIYFFKRLGAMYKMYRELRKGFDKYIENDREVIKRLSEIMSGYYNKKNPGTTIESWRTMEDAQTFNFEHGPVTLSVAQMMEVYLYANRPQAFGHMIGDGIIVTPISPVGKIETAKEKLLGHEPMVDPVRLTYENVQEIISKLSEEQVNMANKLQELVAGYMSDLGNETTMKLYGYKMFDDPNYFGIHVSQTATNSSVDAPAITETIKNFGWTKPLTPGAKNTIVIGDIFTDVARYCNEMNQFNAYAVPVSDFMRVYNYKLRDENGELKGSAKSAIIKAFGNQAHTYIMNFLRDLNGASMRRNGGLEGMIDSALGRAKKAAVFMNMRVALQQPTAIVRALAQINAKYFVGVRPSAEATKEMIEHCPIAQWKAWGFYDTHFGRDVEDLIMNNWSKADVVGSALYGALDNMTWGMIWQAVKKEVEAKQPALEKGSPAYWEACNRRASEVFDSTQVVDSPFHRSDAMRSKDTLVKQFTSFQAEPTLSFNVVRDFAVQAYDAVADGDKTKAAKLIAKGVEVWTLQAAVVAVAQSLWDAVRHKDPDGDDDEDEKFFELWWQNFMADFADDMKFYNNIYFLKEFTPYAEKLVEYMKTGKWNTYDSNKLLMFQGAEKITQGLQQLIKKIQKGDDYKHKNGEPYTWYEVMTNFLGGVGYLTGMPIGTVMRDAQSILKWFNINVFATDGSDNTDEKKTNNIVDSILEKMGYRKKESDSTSDEEGKSDKQDEKTAEEKRSLEADNLEKMKKNAPKKAGDYSGADRDHALWDVVSDGYTGLISDGRFGDIEARREVFIENGGNASFFDKKVTEATKKAYKKVIGGEKTADDYMSMVLMEDYMSEHGVSDAQISDIAYHSNTAKDLKAAMRMGNEKYIIDELVPLIAAGLTREDFEKLYKNRNRGANTYSGKYTDPKYTKTTGTFIWPTNGVITSHFGYRNAPTAGASSNHPAIDIGASQGTPVVAADGGVVISAGANGGYGNSVGIRHSNGMVTWYNHLYGWNVKVGDQVGQGQQIGQVGSTGISTGPHLDFKIIDADGNPVDPEKYLNKRS